MAGSAAYSKVRLMSLEHLAASDDAPVADIAARMKAGARSESDASLHAGRQTESERLAYARRLATATPFDRTAFAQAVQGLDESAEKRFLMALAASRDVKGTSVPGSAAEDLATALQRDPGNSEYLLFAQHLMAHMTDKDLRAQIQSELDLIDRMKASGQSEHGRWV